jgi:hypothetical protein
VGLLELADELAAAAEVRDEPWRQQHDEPAKHYGFFRAYLEAGPGRNMRELAEQLGVKYPNVRNVAYRHFWTERARAWDEHLARVSDDEWRKDARELTAQQRKTSMKLARAFDAWVDKSMEDGTLAGMKPAEWVRLWEAALKAGVARVPD